MSFEESIKPLKSGNYYVRLLENEDEVRQYQDLRYQHLILYFNPEKAKYADKNATDYNIGYDKQTSQLCAFYHDPQTDEHKIVGGYVLMRFKKEDSFCKATLKYDLSKLFKKHKFETLEISRAVTHPDHRIPTVIELLWNGVMEYIKTYNNLRFAIGTMSFKGVDPLAYNDAASYLYHYYLMPEDLMIYPLTPKDAKGSGGAYYHKIIPKEELNRDAAISQLPPLLRTYLRLGAEVGTGFYIDYDLKTVETLAILDMQKYGKQALK